MKTYVGVKVIEAEPLNLGDYNQLRGWTIPENEDPKREGYLVKYPNGHVTWSPKEVFEEANCEIPKPAAKSKCEWLKMFASPDWKKRGRGELLYIREKVENLKKMLSKYVKDELDFTPNCSVELLTEQLNAMTSYLNILELRAEFEKF